MHGARNLVERQRGRYCNTPMIGSIVHPLAPEKVVAWMEGYFKSNAAKPPFSAFSRAIQALIRKNALLPLDLLSQSLLNPPQY